MGKFIRISMSLGLVIAIMILGISILKKHKWRLSDPWAHITEDAADWLAETSVSLEDNLGAIPGTRTENELAEFQDEATQSVVATTDNDETVGYDSDSGTSGEQFRSPRQDKKTHNEIVVIPDETVRYDSDNGTTGEQFRSPRQDEKTHYEIVVIPETEVPQDGWFEPTPEQMQDVMQIRGRVETILERFRKNRRK